LRRKRKAIAHGIYSIRVAQPQPIVNTLTAKEITHL
jgi:hypothetical protein